MADKYPNFAALARNEQAGVDYAISVRRARRDFALIAPHGGGIVPGTSEIADAIGAGAFSFYTLEGLKSSGNGGLHITSTRFDEPMCLTLIGQTDVVVTLHGEHSTEDGEGVFIGGLDSDRRHRDPGRTGSTRFRRAKAPQQETAGARANQPVQSRHDEGWGPTRTVTRRPPDDVRVADQDRAAAPDPAVRGIRQGSAESPRRRGLMGWIGERLNRCQGPVRRLPQQRPPPRDRAPASHPRARR